MSIIPKIDDYHKANFVITVVTASYHRDDNLQRPRWWQRWRHDDSRFSVQWHTEYLTNVHWYLSTIYGNLFSDIFHHHSEPFVKMLNESIFHSCHQTKLNNILVNDCNILPSFRRISYFHPEVSFKATKSIDRSGTHAVSVYATGFHSRDSNVRDEM